MQELWWVSTRAKTCLTPDSCVMILWDFTLRVRGVGTDWHRMLDRWSNMCTGADMPILMLRHNNADLLDLRDAP